MFEASLVNDKLNIYANFTNIEKGDDGSLRVRGYATTSDVDSQGHIIELDATKDAVVEYAKWRNLREMHQPSAVGTVPFMKMDEKGLFIEAEVVDAEAIKKIEKGVYKGFSIGGAADPKFISQEVTKDGTYVLRVKKYNMDEISVVDKPANTKSTFTIAKVDSTPEKTENVELKKEAINEPATIPENKIEKPFAGYENFDECLKANSDKEDPKAYCAKIMNQTEKKEEGVEKIQKAETATSETGVSSAEKVATHNLPPYAFALVSSDGMSMALPHHSAGTKDGSDQETVSKELLIKSLRAVDTLVGWPQEQVAEARMHLIKHAEELGIVVLQLQPLAKSQVSQSVSESAVDPAKKDGVVLSRDEYDDLKLKLQKFEESQTKERLEKSIAEAVESKLSELKPLRKAMIERVDKDASLNNNYSEKTAGQLLKMMEQENKEVSIQGD